MKYEPISGGKAKNKDYYEFMQRDNRSPGFT